MKIILSRKGFDSTNGGCPSPILPDGTLLSLPVPSNDKQTYSDLAYRGLSYDKLLKQLNPKGNYSTCHCDPDIRRDVHIDSAPLWEPLFGQGGSAQGLLSNLGIATGDLFLFFGWFKQVYQTVDGGLRYIPGAPDVHAIWGYLQVDKIITQVDEKRNYAWHPHANVNRPDGTNNTIYSARKTLSFDDSKLGSGTLKLSENRVLTLNGASKAIWKEIPALMPSNLIKERKNSAKGKGIFYGGIWQELVLKENSTSEEWAKTILA